MPNTIKEEISRLKELMYPKSQDEVLKEDIYVWRPIRVSRR